jgi:flagellar protein FlbT
MALKVELKPGERIIIGDSVITNDDQRTKLTIEGDAPILREKDILTPETANTPAKRIYLCVQLMYLDGSALKHTDNYLTLLEEFFTAAPSTKPILEAINKRILTGEFYKALREAKKLLGREKELLGHVLNSDTSLRKNKSANG